jgi:multidrug efflux pump subunit AcrA (membrane-fusion protein)
VRERQFVSPHDGVVVAVFKGQGESAALHDPLFRVVNTDRLRVTGYLDVLDAWRVRVGESVRISPEIAGVEAAVSREPFWGHVVFVDNQIDPKTQTCKVTAEVDNRDGLLRAGLEARMEILPQHVAEGKGAAEAFPAGPGAPRVGPGETGGSRSAGSPPARGALKPRSATGRDGRTGPE